MPDERVARLLAVAVHDVDDPGRHARLDEQLDERSARSGVSSAGLSTTVFPQTSAGQSFQDGIAIGKFHGVIAPTTPIGIRTLIMNLSGAPRRRLAEEAPSLAGHVVAHVDRLLDVAPGLGLDLPHLAGHQVGELCLPVAEELGDPEDDLPASGRRHEPPLLECDLRGGDRAIDVGPARPGNVASASPVAGTNDSNRSPLSASTHSPAMKFSRGGTTAMP